MAKLYNQQTVARNVISVGQEGANVHTYKGFSSTENKTGFKIFDIDLVKRDLLNHFYIRKGEKLENPNFGTIIWDMLFEPFTEDVKKAIAKNVEEIINYDPRIQVNSVLVDSTDYGIRIEAELVYLPFNISEAIQFDFDKQNRQVF
jgi:phage baseplate assembly protein W